MSIIHFTELTSVPALPAPGPQAYPPGVDVKKMVRLLNLTFAICGPVIFFLTFAICGLVIFIFLAHLLCLD